MRTIKYKGWQVQTDNDEPVTEFNYSKYTIIIRKADGKYVIGFKGGLRPYQVEALLSGNETVAQRALEDIIYIIEDNLNTLKQFNKDKSNFKHG